MAAFEDLFGDPEWDRPGSETSTQRLREQAQRDFEIEFLGRILERDPYYADVVRVQATNHCRRGEYHRAMQLDRRMTRLQPERPIPWYNLACSFALLGMIEPAFEALERAVELGYRDLRRLRRDPDLKSLRRDPRFDRLVRLV